MDFATDLYTHKALDEETFKDLKECASPSKKSNRTIEKDDFER